MATNLVSSIMQFLTPDMVAKIARTLGIDPDVARMHRTFNDALAARDAS